MHLLEQPERGLVEQLRDDRFGQRAAGGAGRLAGDAAHVLARERERGWQPEHRAPVGAEAEIAGVTKEVGDVGDEYRVLVAANPARGACARDPREEQADVRSSQNPGLVAVIVAATQRA